MALSVGLKVFGDSFVPHRDGLFEGSRDDSLDGPDLITLVQGLAPGSGWWVGNLHHLGVVIVACYRA
jgi:hypothetical protein